MVFFRDMASHGLSVLQWMGLYPCSCAQHPLYSVGYEAARGYSGVVGRYDKNTLYVHTIEEWSKEKNLKRFSPKGEGNERKRECILLLWGCFTEA